MRYTVRDTMMYKFVIVIFVNLNSFITKGFEEETIGYVDLTQQTKWKNLAEYYGAIEKHWKICVNCGHPGLGTAMHLEYAASVGSMHPAVIPPEYLVTRLAIIDLSEYTARDQNFVLSLEVALQWPIMKYDPHEPTLLLFKFGWIDDSDMYRMRSCVCRIPGISYEVAEWISHNMTHVVGVATDAPTLESEQTREFTSRTVSNLLGKSGVYMIENVNIRNKIPEHGCLAISMPLKLLNTNYVPTRLTAFCPNIKTNMHVVLALRGLGYRLMSNRLYDVKLDELLNNK